MHVTVSADDVNQRIRAFMQPRVGRPLQPEEREQYERLLAEWTAAEVLASATPSPA